ncbi:MAG TPA: polysaccharide deacetylase family protein [Puia sp.]|jgi:peptidoglycan/xylan/chitin deacetylase (PgdA/CDA1 family)|nr:polysaccharide deacetylase family protein [Puia sp.]
MFWNFHKILVICTGGAMIFSPNTTNRTEMEGGGSVVTRSVKHRAEEKPYCIFLSWDDGPSEGSQSVNELALKDSLSINVFLIGRNACLTERSRAMVLEYAANPMVEIGNHSFTHANRKYEAFFRDPEVVLADFNRSRDSLHLTNGLTRLPGRNFFRLGSFSRNDHNNGKESADVLAANGYSVFGWDLEWRRKAGHGISTHTGEAMFQIVGEMLEKKRTFVPGYLVLLLHDQDCRDGHFRDELEEFIRLAREDGRYRFGHLSEMTGN